MSDFAEKPRPVVYDQGRPPFRFDPRPLYAAHPKDGRGLLLRTNEDLLLVEFASAE
jgi:hypothetical protein